LAVAATEEYNRGIMENYIYLALTTITSAFVGSFLAGYLKKKGESLATHEDFEKVLGEMRVVTKTTKEIEASITDKVWDRQKRWELKRDILFEAARRLAEIDDMLISLTSTFQFAHQHRTKEWEDKKAKVEEHWFKASAAFEETRLLVEVICENETIAVFKAVAQIANRIAIDIAKKDPKAYGDFDRTFAINLSLARTAIRKELGIESQPTAKSDGSSASPNPD
jgi:hypothetical protein